MSYNLFLKDFIAKQDVLDEIAPLTYDDVTVMSEDDVLLKNSNPSAGPEDRLLSGRGWGQGPESRLSQHARPCPVPTGGAPVTDLEQVGPATPPPRDVTPAGPCASV